MTKKVGKPMKKAVATLLALAMTASVGLGTLGMAAADVTAPKSPYAGKYYTDYNTFEEAKKAAEELTREIAQEGDVLLKNDRNALPLNGTERVSVFGVKSDNLVGASDSAGAHNTDSTSSDSTLVKSLTAAGFKVNPTLSTYYDNNSAKIGNETVIDNSEIKSAPVFPGSVKSSFSLYNDVAFILISREGGEGSDAARVTSETVGEDNGHRALLEKEATPTTPGGPGGPGGGGAPAAQADGADDAAASGKQYYKHSLMLTDSEEALIDQVKTKFKKVVIITNTSNPIEIDGLKNDDDIDAIVHIGRPGMGGLDGLCDILKGSVAPSGGLVDEWMVDFTSDPTWYNFGNNNQTKGFNGAAGSSAYLNASGVKTGSADKDGGTAYEGGEGYYGVDYEENIYLGYKYYETVYNEIARGNLTYTDGVLAEADTYDVAAAIDRTTNAANITAANEWYDANVAYPFGYGMSYTTFSFNIGGKIYTDAACSAELTDTSKFGTADSGQIKELYIPVTVKNTGSVAGKKTVQIYVSAPYTQDNIDNGVEKSAVTLVGFAKTDVLRPGAEETVVVKVNVQDMASWDSTADNGAGKHKGHYILDAGEYTIRAMEDSHFDYSTDVAATTDAYDEYKFTLAAKADITKDDFSGKDVNNLFTTGDNDTAGKTGANTEVDTLNYGNIRTADMMADGGTAMTLIKRNSLVDTFPEAPKTSDLTFKNEVLKNWAFWDNFVVSSKIGQDSNATDKDGNVTDTGKTHNDRNSSYDAQKHYVSDKTTDPWYKTKAQIPSDWTQATGVYDANHMVQTNRTTMKFPMYVSQAENSPVKYKDMFGVGYDEVVANTDADKAVFGAANVGKKKWDVFLNQLTYDELCSVVEFGGYSTVDIASVGKIKTEDSDGPVNWDSSHCWTSADIVASTWNVELAERQGKLIGNLGLLKDPTSSQTGWYGPGADTHRSPFSGRNNEYYSQDGLQAGYMVSAVIQGVQDKGIVCYVKHCFMNDQETNRGNLFTWASEQSMRENYAKAFQMALQEGGSKGAMVGYGRLGGISNTNNYNMNTELYQNQWDTQACFVTDGYIGWRMRTSPDMMVRAGNVFELWTTPFVEYLSGEWDAEKGTVMLGEDESYTQWYAVRECAKSVLYNTASTAAQRNGYASLVLPGGNLAAGTQSVSYEADLGINSLIDSDSTVTKISASKPLPMGLELDGVTGKLSGKPAVAGKYVISVDYIIDGYIQRSANYNLEVNGAVSLDADGDAVDAMKVGEEFMTRLTSGEFTSDKYSKIEYSIKSGALPAGLTLSPDGKIEGTPTAAGTYNVVFKLTAEKQSGGSGGNKRMSAVNGDKVAPARMGNKGEPTVETTEVEYAVTFVVAGAGGAAEWTENVPYIGDNGNWFVNGVDTGKPAQGAAGQNGANGEAGAAASGSVAGIVLGSIALAIAVGATAAGTVLYIKKRKQD